MCFESIDDFLVADQQHVWSSNLILSGQGSQLVVYLLLHLLEAEDRRPGTIVRVDDLVGQGPDGVDFSVR